MTIPPTPSPPPTTPMPRLSSTLPLARWLPSRMFAPDLSGRWGYRPDERKIMSIDGAVLTAIFRGSVQSEKRQDGDDDDHRADQPNDFVHKLDGLSRGSMTESRSKAAH